MVCFVYIIICGLNKRFNIFKKEIWKIVVDFRDGGRFDVDWSEVFCVVERTFDFLENEGVKFDFNDPVVKRFVKNDVEMCIRRLIDGGAVEVLDFVYFNDLDDGKEVISDLERFKQVLDSEFHRKTLERILISSNKGRPRFDVVLMFKIVIL